MNAWICAPPTSDHDLANASFEIRSVTTVTSVMSVIFLRSYNLIQAYGFRFYFLLVIVIILAGMVLPRISKIYRRSHDAKTFSGPTQLVPALDVCLGGSRFCVRKDYSVVIIEIGKCCIGSNKPWESSIVGK